MFGRSNKEDAQKLVAVEEKLLKELAEHDPETKEYAEAFNHWERVNNLKTKVERKISLDQLVLAGAHLLGIVIVVAYEQKHVMTSKAKDYALKLK